MATKTATKTNRNAKAATKATTTKKNATVAKPVTKESKRRVATKEPIKKLSQLDAAVQVLADSNDPMNC